jgi:hypothetical protein
MADWMKDAAPYAGPASTLVGTAIGAAGGPAGMAVGATVGGAVGSLISGALNLGQDAPDFPGPSEEEQVLLARQTDLANRLYSIEGMTPQEVSNFTNMALEQDLRAQQVINAYASVDKMSPLEKQVIQDRAETMRVAGQMDAREELMRINAGTAAARVGQALSAGQSAFGMASTVQQKEATQRMQTLNFKRAQLESFGQAVQAAGYGAAAAGQLYDKFNEANAWGWGDSDSGMIDVTEAKGPVESASQEQVRDFRSMQSRTAASAEDMAVYQGRAAARRADDLLNPPKSPVEIMMDANLGFMSATGQSPYGLTLNGMDFFNSFSLESD